ncbi:MAG: phenylacetate--CoA ligase family protein, partial [Novosphingobium meiothermophilum]
EGRDAMTAHLEVRGHTDDALRDRLEGVLRQRLGVEVSVALCAPGSLAPLTQVESRQKPIRLIDDRK